MSERRAGYYHRPDGLPVSEFVQSAQRLKKPKPGSGVMFIQRLDGEDNYEAVWQGPLGRREMIKYLGTLETINNLITKQRPSEVYIFSEEHDDYRPYGVSRQE